MNTDKQVNRVSQRVLLSDSLCVAHPSLYLCVEKKERKTPILSGLLTAWEAVTLPGELLPLLNIREGEC